MAPLLRPSCHASTMWRLTYSFSLLCIFDALDGHLHLPHCKKASMELSCGVTKTVQWHYWMYWRVWSLLLFAILAPSSLQVETRSSQVPVRVATHGQGPVRHENSICVSSSVDSSSKCVCVVARFTVGSVWLTLFLFFYFAWMFQIVSCLSSSLVRTGENTGSNGKGSAQCLTSITSYHNRLAEQRHEGWGDQRGLSAPPSRPWTHSAQHGRKALLRSA